MTVLIGGTEYSAAQLIEIIAQSDNDSHSQDLSEVQTLVEGLHAKADDIKAVVDGIEFHDTDMSEVLAALASVSARLSVIEARLPISWVIGG